MSKGSQRRPGVIIPGLWEQIFSKPGKCPICHENVPKCACAPTDDGPADVQMNEQRKHSKEGV